MRPPPFAFASSAVCSSALAFAAFAATSEERIDRNFEPAAVSGPKVPAVPDSRLRISEGSVKVRIGFRKFTLETISVVPPGDGPFPLAVVSHGTPTRSGKGPRRTLRIRQMLPIAEDFARRGYKAVVFARRGYASSTGQYREGYGKCSNASEALYVRLARRGAKEFKAIIKALASDSDVDGSTVIAAGHSGGGFVASALASDSTPGLRAIINFAGGRGGAKEGGNCSEAGFVGAFAEFGRGATVPALWIYATSDRMFWPDLVDRALAAYARDGAPVRLERVGPLWFTGNGHLVHFLGARELWRPRIDAFLDAVGVQSWDLAPDDGAVEKLPPPRDLGERGGRRWKLYLGFPGHKAFALGDERQFGWSALQDSPESAVASAMKDCEKRGGRCRIVSIAGEMVP